jgi:hypothetical protein
MLINSYRFFAKIMISKNLSKQNLTALAGDRGANPSWTARTKMQCANLSNQTAKVSVPPGKHDRNPPAKRPEG